MRCWRARQLCSSLLLLCRNTRHRCKAVCEGFCSITSLSSSHTTTKSKFEAARLFRSVFKRPFSTRRMRGVAGVPLTYPVCASARGRRGGSCCAYGCRALPLFLILVLLLLFDVLLGFITRLPEVNLAKESDAVSFPFVPDGRWVPWLTCDCASEDVLDGLDTFVQPTETALLKAELQKVYGLVDRACGVCVASSLADMNTKPDWKVLFVYPTTEGEVTTHRFHGLSTIGQMIGAVTHGLWSAGYAVAALLFPNGIALYEAVLSWYARHVETVEAQFLEDRQNRGLAGHVVHPATLWSFVQALVYSSWKQDDEPVIATPFSLINADPVSERYACQQRAPLARTGLPRHALPWLEIQAATFRSTPDVPTDPGPDKREGLRVPVRNGQKTIPEITVSVPSPLGGSLRSYFCSDMVNITETHLDFYMDPEHNAAMDRSYGTQQQDLNGKSNSMFDAQCKGCKIHCLHPRFTPHLRRRRHIDGVGADHDEGGMISWDVSVDDVDAGLIQFLGEDKKPITVTHEDLFTCQILYPRGQVNPRDPIVNRALLLSSDAWISHFESALPFIYANYSSANDAAATPSNNTGNGEVYGNAITTAASSFSTAVPTRLLPIHTVAVYGESLQSFPDYALRQAHWTQFDTVFLQQKVRRPSLLPSAASLKRQRTTEFFTWTFTHLYFRDFQLIVYLNQQLRALQLRDPQRTFLVERDLAKVIKDASGGAVPQLALELLHGADEMLLPMPSKNRPAAAGGGGGETRWYPPTVDDWSGTYITEINGTKIRQRLQPSSPAGVGGEFGRLPAIAVVISHCWHGRMWWLSELSRYYPVHNFGRCRIPPPARLPWDTEDPPTSTNGIEQRAKYDFPPDCRGDYLDSRHRDALKRPWQHRPSAKVSRSRQMLHGKHDHELRCVFKKYKYILAFENSIEDDYVTEKVYNALLSGALPLYIGAMNIDQYVPQSGQRHHQSKNNSNNSHMNAKGEGVSQGSVPPLGLSILPVLQLFPILNETAARLEDRRVLGLHETDEAVSSHVFRTHAAALRTRAARVHGFLPQPAPPHNTDNGVRRVSTIEGRFLSQKSRDAAATTAELVARAMDGVAQQASHNAHVSHFLLYSTTTERDANDTTQQDAQAVAPPPLFYRPVGIWPAPTSDAATCAENTNDNNDDARLDVGLPSLLRRLHRDLNAYDQYQHNSSHNNRRGKPTRGGDTTPSVQGQSKGNPEEARKAGVSPDKRAVRGRPEREFALTMNTAFAFAEEVDNKKAHAAKWWKRTADPPKLPDRIEVFHEEEEKGGNTNGKSIDVSARVNSLNNNNTTSRVQLSKGNVFSEFFVRRELPPAAAYNEIVQEPKGPPLNGFAQLAAYLRVMDADPSVAEEAGYFDWWKSETMEDLGDVFLEKLHIPHPICSICAGALEKKIKKASV